MVELSMVRARVILADMQDNVRRQTVGKGEDGFDVGKKAE